VTSRLDRRAVVGAVAALALHCKNGDDAPPTAGPAPSRAAAPPPPAVSSAPATELAAVRSDAFIEKELVFDSTPVGPEKAVAIVPQWGAPEQRFPLLVALHGRGESVRGVDVGAHGWMRDYELGHAIARLRSPPLTREDFKGFVEDARLARINASLAERPFRGLIVVCPWVPDLFTDRDRTNLDAALPYSRFLVEQLLPRAQAETPALRDREATGIDGVSLGGRVALVVGFAYPGRFGALGTLQAAIQESEPVALARRAKSAMMDAQKLRLRLVTSDQDYFRGAIGQLHLALDGEGIEHEHLVLPGPHDYIFNRGPGGVEMLLWHDRVLRGEPGL
jgi:enterochelin esterase-like enzyme